MEGKSDSVKPSGGDFGESGHARRNRTSEAGTGGTDSSRPAPLPGTAKTSDKGMTNDPQRGEGTANSLELGRGGSYVASASTGGTMASSPSAKARMAPHQVLPGGVVRVDSQVHQTPQHASSDPPRMAIGTNAAKIAYRRPLGDTESAAQRSQRETMVTAAQVASDSIPSSAGEDAAVKAGVQAAIASMYHGPHQPRTTLMQTADTTTIPAIQAAVLKATVPTVPLDATGRTTDKTKTPRKQKEGNRSAEDEGKSPSSAASAEKTASQKHQAAINAITGATPGLPVKKADANTTSEAKEVDSADASLAGRARATIDNSLLTDVVDGPLRLDVICGIDRDCQRHEGNLEFRKLVRQHRDLYQGKVAPQERQSHEVIFPPRAEKSRIIKLIMRTVSTWRPGGRFVRFNHDTKKWHVVGEEGVYEKVQHALRHKSKLKPGEKRRGKKMPEKLSNVGDQYPSDHEFHRVFKRQQELLAESVVKEFGMHHGGSILEQINELITPVEPDEPDKNGKSDESAVVTTGDAEQKAVTDSSDEKYKKESKASATGYSESIDTAKPIKDPRPLDVLCGKGGRTNYNFGNIRLRRLVNQNKAIYHYAGNSPGQQKLKTCLAQSIVDTIREFNGRFVKKFGEVYFDIGNSEARGKVSQTLRDSTVLKDSDDGARKAPAYEQRFRASMAQNDGRASFGGYGSLSTSVAGVDIAGDLGAVTYPPALFRVGNMRKQQELAVLSDLFKSTPSSASSGKGTRGGARKRSLQSSSSSGHTEKKSRRSRRQAPPLPMHHRVVTGGAAARTSASGQSGPTLQNQPVGAKVFSEEERAAGAALLDFTHPDDLDRPSEQEGEQTLPVRAQGNDPNHSNWLSGPGQGSAQSPSFVPPPPLVDSAQKSGISIVDSAQKSGISTHPSHSVVTTSIGSAAPGAGADASGEGR